MNREPATINASSVSWATDIAKERIRETLEQAVNLSQDPRKADRLANGECLSCYYVMGSRLGGAAMTYRPCGLCGNCMTFGCTVVDEMCKECSTAHELCKHCGADIKLRVRRVFDKTKGED